MIEFAPYSKVKLFSTFCCTLGGKKAATDAEFCWKLRTVYLNWIKRPSINFLYWPAFFFQDHRELVLISISQWPRGEAHRGDWLPIQYRVTWKQIRQIYTLAHIWWQFKVTNEPNVHVFGQWEETIILRINTHNAQVENGWGGLFSPWGFATAPSLAQ